VFCNDQPDDHQHLFFNCEFPAKIWNCLKCQACLENAPNEWDQLKEFMVNLHSSKSVWSIIQKLLIAACVYYVWQERNLRTFQQKNRNWEDVVKIIKEDIKYKLMSLNLKSKVGIVTANEFWKFLPKTNDEGH
jgi:hypothetical protein